MATAIKKEYYSLSEIAKILGISRIAVYKRVKKGRIKAKKIGRNFAVPARVVDGIIGKDLSREKKTEIEKAVKKTVQEYGEVLKKLGNN